MISFRRIYPAQSIRSDARIPGLLTGLCLAASLAFTAAPLAAQVPMTEAEMTEALKKQKTRGLSLAIPAPATAEPTGSTSVIASPVNPGSVLSPGPSETAIAVSAPAIPKDEQVNINIRFDFDSAALRPDQKPQLMALCNAVKGAGVDKLRILGHTDSAGSSEYNRRLSLLRAEEVRRHLAADCGLPLEQMEAIGMGKDALFDPQNPRHEINRRVEFQALS